MDARPLLALLCLAAAARARYIDSLTYDDVPALAAQPSLLFLTVRWCDHCASLRPEIAALARAARSNPRVLVARADADDHPAVAARFAVVAFPTILFFPPGFDLADRAAAPPEYADWRWAEVIAEFVNNATREHTIVVPPRDSFLRWRKRNPWNRATQQTEEVVEEAGSEEAYDDGISRMPIREPMNLTPENTATLLDSDTRYMVLFYREGYPFLRELKLQWKQASSAFAGAENVTIALADVSDDHALAERFGVDDTPACRYFPQCHEKCEIVDCTDDIDDTENIVQFLSDRVMLEMGIHPEDHEVGRSYTLTEEQYQLMKADGVVFANDADSQDAVRDIYEQHAAGKAADGRDAQDKPVLDEVLEAEEDIEGDASDATVSEDDTSSEDDTHEMPLISDDAVVVNDPSDKVDSSSKEEL